MTEPAPAASPSPPSVNREVLADELARTIVDIVHGEGGLVQLARQVEGGDPGTRLPDESCEAVGTILWEAADVRDMAVAARLSGYLTALFDLALNFELGLPPEVEALQEWGETINPA